MRPPSTLTAAYSSIITLIQIKLLHSYLINYHKNVNIHEILFNTFYRKILNIKQFYQHSPKTIYFIINIIIIIFLFFSKEF